MRNEIDIELIESCFKLGQLLLLSFLGAIVSDIKNIFSPIIKAKNIYSEYVSLIYASVFFFCMSYAGLNSLEGWGFALYLCLVLGFLNSRNVEKIKR